jgi:hypothetical protein
MSNDDLRQSIAEETAMLDVPIGGVSRRLTNIIRSVTDPSEKDNRSRARADAAKLSPLSRPSAFSGLKLTAERTRQGSSVPQMWGLVPWISAPAIAHKSTLARICSILCSHQTLRE